ncbi:MAG TPA: ABC transporter permease [Thermoanaerobaculia bacterium]|jgi:putative ABC transport system permease protein|nr:ABC transporter permease [Thermoanaerobaculia bacterium]
MFRWFSQVAALTLFNLKTLPQRLGSVAAAVVGMAGVVAVLVGVLSIQQGFRRTMAVSGAPDVALVLRGGSDGEMTSILGRDDVRLIAEGPGLARDSTGALASPELFVIINLPKKSTGTDANVPMRGVTPAAFGVHDQVKLVEGRRFEWGRNEVIVGRAAQGQFRGLDVGSQLHLGQNVWTVVGAFTADGGLPESEIWTDAAVLQPAYRRGNSFQSLKAKLVSAGSFQRFKDALTADPRLNVKVQRETEFYAGQSRALTAIVTILGLIIGILMGLGAVFGALNTMYTAVAARSREIATLRALGFRSSPVLLSVIAESIALAALGGAVGALGAWLAFDGYQAATMNWQSFSQVAFAFRVGPALLLLGLFYALALGLVGGLFPAIRAARLPVATALRE